MNRKDFILKTIATGVGVLTGTSMLKASNVRPKNSDYDALIDRVGFPDLSRSKNSHMKYVIHKANSRGHANHGWLNSHHSFSFANYHNPERMNFGVLRVLNDDIVAAGQGFGTHPHDNMEIISIPLAGDLEHKDSMGNITVIKEGDVQVMSAGTGIFHSEYNKNADKEVKFLQIWLFPNQKQVEPRYDQLSIKDIAKKNEFYQVLSPSKEDQGVWIHQNAWFHLGDFDEGISQDYTLKNAENGLYVFVLEGSICLQDTVLNKRDGIGLWDINTALEITATSQAKILLMEIPMHL